jgi:outer membrane protein OmpA-like peptidoglycan-associated protein
MISLLWSSVYGQKKSKRLQQSSPLTTDSLIVKEEIRADKLVYVYEQIYIDSKTNHPIPFVNVEITDAYGVSKIQKSDSAGVLSMQYELSDSVLKNGLTIYYKVGKQCYLSVRGERSIVDSLVQKQYRDTVFLEYALLKELKLPEINFYDSRIYVGDDYNSYDSLKLIYDFLVANPYLVVELQFNTDCRGSDIYNKNLTQRRAQSCKEYLEHIGIELDRITAKGYGKSNPIPGLDCESIKKLPSKEEMEQAHAKNRRSTLKVMGCDYVAEDHYKTIKLEYVVWDANSSIPISGAKIWSYDSNQEYYSNEKGYLMIEKRYYFNRSNEYNFKIVKSGYDIFNVKVLLDEERNSTDTIKLYRIPTTFQMPTIYYQYDSYALREDSLVNSKDSLDLLYHWLIDHPNVVIEIQNHSDCRGSMNYSTNLTQRRAQECVNYLVSKGVPKERLFAKGYGDTKPLPSLDCESIKKMQSKEEQEKAHQQNRRTVVNILAYDYVPHR